jgi:predicted amidohydrolase YtcJ
MVVYLMIGPLEKQNMNDTVFRNADVVTMNPQMPRATTFAVRGGRFYAIGSENEVRRTFSGESDVVDLGGKTVIPGIIESHCHISDYALSLGEVNCATPPNQSTEDVIAGVRERAESTPPGKWIKGWGYDDTLMDEKRHLTRHDLDEASPRHPVFISHITGHVAYANSRALEIANIGPESCNPTGGVIEKNQNGVPTGVLYEDAQIAVAGQIPILSVAQMKIRIREAIKHYHAHGITSVHDAAIGYCGTGLEVIEAYRELETEKRLDLRLYLTIVEKAYRKILSNGWGRGIGTTYIKLGGVKLFQDGSIQILTAALAKPYYNQGEQKGFYLIPQETLNALVAEYHRKGLQVAVHANGDGAINSAITAFENACKEVPDRDHRHMIIHCQLATHDHIRKMKQLGIVPSYFPNHIYYWGDRHLSLFLGSERAARIDPLGSSLKAGLTFSLHSDHSVTPVDPFFSMHCAVNRMTKDGNLLGADERIEPLAALKAYTTDAAYCSFEEHLKGSIEDGKLADFSVLSDNPLTINPEHIKDIHVEATVVGGKAVYLKK